MSHTNESLLDRPDDEPLSDDDRSAASTLASELHVISDDLFNARTYGDLVAINRRFEQLGERLSKPHSCLEHEVRVNGERQCGKCGRSLEVTEL